MDLGSAPMPKGLSCELCAEAAAVYCPSDSAYLCWNCDSAVHSANFLVARHLRSVITKTKDAESEDEGSSISEISAATNESSTAAGECCGEVSSVMRRRVDARAEGVLVSWCRRLGEGRAVAEASVRVVGLGRPASLPGRVALAASLWVGLRCCGGRRRDLRRVEKTTGVPGRLVLALEPKLERLLRARHCKEGWAECSP